MKLHKELTVRHLKHLAVSEDEHVDYSLANGVEGPVTMDIHSTVRRRLLDIAVDPTHHHLYRLNYSTEREQENHYSTV